MQPKNTLQLSLLVLEQCGLLEHLENKPTLYSVDQARLDHGWKNIPQFEIELCSSPVYSFGDAQDGLAEKCAESGPN